jgi:monovalent cation/hydrogen antiporter
MLAFTGVRGIVSLAAALAIPFVTDDGQRFPDRDLILFLTFAVILVTLVGQGLLLPTIIRALGLAEAGRIERLGVRAEEFSARRQAIEAAIEQLDELTTARGLPEEIVGPIRLHQQSRLNSVWHRSEDGETHQRIVKTADEIERLLIGVERDRVNQLYYAGKLKDEARRRIERDLDLRESRLTNLLANE